MVVLTTTWGLAGIRCARREDSVGKQGVSGTVLIEMGVY